MTECYCCHREAQFIWQREFVVDLCGRCFFDAVRAWNSFSDVIAPNTALTFDRLMISLVAYVECGKLAIAGKRLGINGATVCGHVRRLELLKGQLVERDDWNRRTPVLNKRGAEFVQRWRDNMERILITSL